MECTCYIKEEDGVEPQLIKCPLCKSAPDLYEACKKALEKSHNPEVEGILMEAIAKVES